MKDPERIFIVIFIIIVISKVVSTAVPALLTQRSPEIHLCSQSLILATGTLAESHSSYLARGHSTPTVGFLSGSTSAPEELLRGRRRDRQEALLLSCTQKGPSRRFP